MKTITVDEMKSHWSDVEAQILSGETLEVMNNGHPPCGSFPPSPVVS